MKSWSGSPTQRGCSEGTQHSPNLQVKNQSEQKSPNKGTNVSTNTSTQYGKRVLCPRCGEYILKRVIRLHSKYYCERDFEEKEWKLVNSLALCLRCHKPQEPNSIEFHVKYICGKNPITVQCFYCQRLFDDYKFLLKHMNTAHKKRHCFLDLLSVLPTADSIDSEYTAPKVVRNFFSNMLNTEQEAILAENKTSVSPHLQLRNKRTHKCETCGKELTGTHEYVNHVNTKCESDNHYSCFYCAFKSVLAYEVLDHMEDSHGKLFNTFDIIQARLTGIIPLIDSNFSDNAGDLPDCQEPEMGHLLNKVIKKEREKTSKLKLQTVTSEPVLKNVKKPVETVPSDLNHDGGTMYTVRDEVLEEDKLSHEELNVEAKYVKIKNHEDLALDVLSETSVCNERKQTNSNFKTFGYNLQDKVTVQPRGSNVKVKAGEKSPVPVRGKENVTESRLNSTDNYLVEETAPEDSTPKSSSKQLFRSSLSPKKNSKLIKIKGNRKKEFSKVNIVSGSVTDKSAAVKSSLGCCSQTVMETGVSPKEKSKAVEIKEESNSQEGNKSKTSPDVCCINEESLIPEDPELDFADKQLYEPFSSPARCLRSASKRVVNLNSRQIISGTIDRNSLEKSKSDKCITVESMSSDPEVDFAKKELFEPYSTPKKDRRSLNIQISSSKKKESQIKTLAKEVRPEVRGSSQTTNKRTPKTGNEAPSQADQGEHEYLNKLKTNNLVQNTKTQRKVGLSVKKRKIIRGNKIIKASRCKTKRNIIKKINCSVCHEDVHPLDMRIHNKYHCGSEPMEKQWILQSGKALCLRCKKIQWSSTIDFHVKYLCNKKRFFLECLYCSKIANCRSVIVHMRKAHGKKHYYQDLMTILPGPEFVSPVKSLQPQFPEKEEEERLIMVVKHPITFHASKKMDVENKEELSKSIIDHSDDYYVCFYCRFKHIIAYKTLDHMEGLHSKKHSLYELLYAKIPTFKQENGLSAVGREAE